MEEAKTKSNPAKKNVAPTYLTEKATRKPLRLVMKYNRADGKHQ